MTNALALISPQLQLKISKRARRMALRLDSRNHIVNLVVPARFSMKKAETFAYEHRLWIREKLAALPAPIPFEESAIIPILGRNRKLAITFHSSHKRTLITLNDDNMSVTTNQEYPQSRIIRFLKNEAQETLTNLVHEKAALIEKSVKSVTLRDTKSRWGSCSPEGRISLSWRLIFAPWEAMDYVVAHEVAHLVHMNHSKDFWHLCAQLSDDYPSGKKWMRQQGHTLMKYGVVTMASTTDYPD